MSMIVSLSVFFSSRRRHTRYIGDWSSDVCSSDLALGMAALLLCAVSPRLILRRVKIPGAAFIASIAYSAYLIQKLVIHFLAQFCVTHNIVLTSAAALLGVELSVYAGATILFFAVERPFLQLRHRIAPRPIRS